MDMNIAELKEAFTASKSFYDDLNFPQGFSRSGHFTLLESDLLQQHGHLLKGLNDEKFAPVNTYQQQFVDMLKHKRPPANRIEKIWCKYLSLTTQKHRIHTLSSQVKPPSHYESTKSNEELSVAEAPN
ncbi:DUF413 domain-containing protein [Pseudoalteromonas luteoviolacea]|uniref:Macrodomain Ori protein n=1 Tax=Pseudoalteromonas luteoviolacea DSM 6061 TaxID=1365250 RepID=A0A161XUU8_9GAMM|nr:DUF413 domain-containing protein [Pseudoalteromonas luteoviolacea]KZN35176.1 hypothetical protein N475_03505 [Pseudoalteromonas luteoviolacea DSM 6061]KZN52927.1 hypothetical protein N474_03145 [Pseudoalteromonas luteoviolacea CPMOR-2]MBE0384920.1 hypothetical protein [Pseudoalteromonas luteoviolacea DSM 6061]TQF66572.1 DUF413 domain-containing protein [Pseudoalteromonas luteoviolacea]